MVKAVYVAKRDEAIIDASEQLAARRGISWSRFVIDALERYVPEAAAQPDPAERWAAIVAGDAA